MQLPRGTLVALSLALCGAARLPAQDVVTFFQRADSADQQHRYADAATLYESAYAISGFQPLMLALAGAEAAKGGQADRAFRDIDSAVTEGFLDGGYFSRDSDIFVLHQDARWAGLEARLQRRRAALDSALITELQQMADSDQAVRQNANAITEKFGRNSPRADSVRRAITASDAPRVARMQAIIAAHGWPGRHLVGDDGAHNAWVLIQHAPLAVQQKDLPLLLAAVRHDDARADDGAYLEDRVLVGEGKPQIYGTQTRFSDTPGPPILDPIANEACVDVRRRKVGMGPLADNLKLLGIRYAGPPGVCSTP